MYSELKDIEGFKSWVVIEKVNKGWSSDSKFYIEDDKGDRLLLRISNIDSYSDKVNEFKFVKKCNTLEFTMSKAIKMGFCNNNKNVYMLLTWVDGESFNTEINKFTKEQQYKFGLEAGKILKDIHSLKVEEEDNLIMDDKKDKMLSNLIRYENSLNRIDDDQIAIDFVRDNIEKINILNPVYKHGDYHLGNLILTPDKKVGVIDFNRWEYGDGYNEFCKIQSFDVEKSIPFSIGQIHGYFGGEPPLEFWNLLAIYVAYTSLSSITWAEKFGEDEINGMKKRCNMAFDDYDKFKKIIPKWYKDNSDKFVENDSY